jgi:hypothetical protein
LDHGNESHSTPFASTAELTAHQNAASVHTAAINLANRDISGPLQGLVPSAQIANLTESPPNSRQALLFGRGWGYPKQAALGYNHGAKTLMSGTGRKHALELAIPPAWISDDMQFTFQFSTTITSQVAQGATLIISAWLGTTMIEDMEIDFSLLRVIRASITGTILGVPTGKVAASIALSGYIDDTPPEPFSLSASSGTLQSRPSASDFIFIDVEQVNPVQGEVVIVNSGYIRALHPIP